MKKLTLLLAAACLMSGGAAIAEDMPAKDADAAAPMMKVETKDFAKAVMGSNEFEIQSSQLAEKKASADDVKTFAADMIKDHKKAESDLTAALGKSDMKAGEAKLAPKQAAMMKQLEAADGKDFQMLYIDMQTQAHMEAVALFRTYSGSGDDKAVVAFAKKTLPTLEEHMMHVKELVKAH